jgi:hypothetical protein
MPLKNLKKPTNLNTTVYCLFVQRVKLLDESVNQFVMEIQSWVAQCLFGDYFPFALKINLCNDIV